MVIPKFLDQDNIILDQELTALNGSKNNYFRILNMDYRIGTDHRDRRMDKVG